MSISRTYRVLYIHKHVYNDDDEFIYRVKLGADSEVTVEYYWTQNTASRVGKTVRILF